MKRRSPAPARVPVMAVAAAAAAILAASCSPPSVEAPSNKGVCWHMVRVKGKPPVFNLVAQNVPNLESCMADLEALRIHFLQLGGDRTTLDGAYQGSFIFVEREGVFGSQKLDGATYLALPRKADGQLVLPGGATIHP